VASVYVDTNIFLDFYRRSGSSLAVFNDLRKLGHRLLFTEQTIEEFERNRASVISSAIKYLSSRIG
jgi:predicted nucleic acid-binding protein